MDSKLNWAATLSAAALAACAAATPYQPLQRGEGYAEQKIEANRYRVRFAGNESTPRQTVETYLLYRAAEITLDANCDYFILADQNTEAQTSYVQAFGGFGGFGRYYWGPRFGADVGTIIPSTEYEARVTILTFKGKKPEADVNAFDAHEVKTNLEAQIVRPKQKKD